MKNDLTCGVVGDLLPSYVENLLGEESRQAVDRHLADCSRCAGKLRAMTAPEEEPPEETAKEVDYLKGIKRKNRLRVGLAALLAAAVIAAGFAVKIFLIGTPLQAQDCALALSTVTEENSLVLVAYTTNSGDALFGWDVDNEDGVISIYARRALVSPFHKSGDYRMEIPLEGVREVWLCGPRDGNLVYQDGMEIRPADLALYNVRTPYAGDAPALGKIVDALGIREDMGEFSTELTTGQRPYRWTLNFRSVRHGYAICFDMTVYKGPLMLALVENLDEVGWTYTEKKRVFTDTIEIEHNHVLTLEEVNQRLPELVERYNRENGTDWPVRESVKDYAQSPAEIVRLKALLSMWAPQIPLPCEG